MILDGANFEPARIREPKPGVVEQYREDRHVMSRHVFERADGTLTVDHTDFVNPDKGPAHAVVHFFADHPIGRCLSVLGGVILFRRLR